MRDRADVLIVGAGAAGLSAANELSAAGVDAMVLEGRQRLGGRIETMHDPAWPLPIERGAEFIHGKPRETWSIAEAGAACLYDLTDQHWVFQNGKLRRREGFFEQIESALAVVNRVGSAPSADISLDEALARHGARQGEAATLARMYVSGFDAADPAQVSAQWLAAVQKASEKIEGDRLFRVYAGYDRIVQFLQSGIADAGAHIETGVVVRKVRWGREGVGVEAMSCEGEARVYTGRAMVITVPIGVLQLPAGEEGHIAFEPELPAGKWAALDTLGMGNVVKVILRFSEPFWEKRVPDLDFCHAPGAAFPTWWTTLPLRTAVLTGWAGGPAADALSGHCEDELLTEAVKTLSRVMGVPRRRIEGLLAGAHVADWRREPLTRGAYSYARVGGLAAVRKLRAAVAGRLFFAGEATEVGLVGTVAGAIASGHRVAREILRSGKGKGGRE
ncbi:MAG TPA: NAD(P)/FAD-dependent oxidoreductase [Phycisphaerae bacterium]|nr:NAD(P)/FAD-dependent oxidoreductase [Phycisphaerae bacterium]